MCNFWSDFGIIITANSGVCLNMRNKYFRSSIIMIDKLFPNFYRDYFSTIYHEVKNANSYLVKLVTVL